MSLGGTVESSNYIRELPKIASQVQRQQVCIECLLGVTGSLVGTAEPYVGFKLVVEFSGAAGEV